MKREIHKIIFLTLAVLVLAGCGKQEERQGIQPVTTQAGDVKMLESAWANTEQGYYHLTNLTEDNVNLCYTDYATCSTSIVCNQPACQHTTKSCTSYFEGKEHGRLFVHAGNLYFLKGPGEGLQLYQAHLDGSEHKKIHTFSKDQYVDYQHAAFDGQYLYFLATGWDDATSQNIPKLLQTNVDTGETSVLFACNQNIGTEEGQQPFSVTPVLAGASNRSLYLTVSYIQRQANQTGITGAMEEDQNRMQALLELDLDSGEIGVQESWKERERQIYLKGDTLFYFDLTDRSLKMRKLAGGETITAVSDLPFKTTEYTTFTENFILFNGVYDGKCILDVYDEDTDGPIRYMVDSQSGDVRPLQLTYSDGGEISRIQVKLETTDAFVVLYDWQEEETLQLHADGTAETITESVPKYALIQKEDYWNSRPNYRPITSINDTFAAH